MIHEEERREYYAILGGLYKVLQERKQAHTSQGDASVHWRYTYTFLSNDTADGPSNEESTDLSCLVRASSPENSECGTNDFQPTVPNDVDEAMPNTSGGHIGVSSEAKMQ
ncbi:hypothetical protein MRX96_014990 [Rhipicephalus microplus]